MDAPARRDDRLLVMNEKVPCFRGRPHHMEDSLIRIHIEVEIDFHPSRMGMARHRVPNASRLKMGQAHLQLAAFDPARDDIAVDGPLIAFKLAAQMAMIGIGQ